MSPRDCRLETSFPFPVPSDSCETHGLVVRRGIPNVCLRAVIQLMSLSRVDAHLGSSFFCCVIGGMQWKCGVRRLFPLPGSAAAASLVSGGRQPALASPTYQDVRTVKAES